MGGVEAGRPAIQHLPVPVHLVLDYSRRRHTVCPRSLPGCQAPGMLPCFPL